MKSWESLPLELIRTKRRVGGRMKVPPGGMMTTTIRIWLLAVCALALGAGIARADVGPRWSDDQLAGFSSAIVAGRVTSIGTGRDIGTGVVHTYVTVAVDTVFKGDIAEREIVVKQLGGRIGDQISL